jgi:lipoate-protein ligase A
VNADDDRLPVVRWDLDDDLIEAAGRERATRIRLARPDAPCVVLGSGSRPDVELELEACLAAGVPLRRRRGGGCAVLLDEGNLVVSIVRCIEGLGGIQTSFRQISSWLAAELSGIGFPGIRQEGTSDLALGDRKIGGSCIFRRRGVLYYSTTLLVSPRIDLMERYIAHPPREPPYRRGRPHREFVQGLADVDPSATIESLAATLETVLLPTRFEDFTRR